ncbi:hypothetical protein GDO81_006944 [Engystomops pustulosus]|uniref:E3 ubiquitin-protein ligase listerin n=1 Tax=Engystomops pustulosus TaxID=76066 RepID=A0AAV7D414_ENGPU|nr:hypothetical protein GDO81_006944 [Engystomops pustulosus]
MGGKNKQRTKGNVRPSSSGRAAELLAKESGTVPGFIGFGTAPSDLGYVPAVQGAEEVDNLVDADFRMVLRKLSKRDVITKLKAMQEFGAMCKEREVEIVRGVLPYWPRNYCKISLDHDRRVREATQQAFEQLILKVKKYLAPHLKNLMGFWLIAQCDTYSPAASAARAAFEAAFPPHKQPEALAFCKDEVLNVLLDHLLKETPDSISDPHGVPASGVVLYTLTPVENCWDHVNAKKGVLPKLWTVLREGGRGLATIIFPNLLPFISKVPSETTQPRIDFYNTLFDSLIQGLSSERAVSSPTECAAVLSAYTDCLRFTMQENVVDSEENTRIRQSLIIDQLIPLIDSSLKDPKLQSSPLFVLVEETIRSWEKKAGSPELGEDLANTYSAILSSFWESLERICVAQVDVIEAGELELAGVSGLLQVMQNPNSSLKATRKKKAKIRFTDEEDNGKDSIQEEPRDSDVVSITMDDQRQKPLQDLVCKLAELSMVYIAQQPSNRHLRFLAALLSAFSSVRVFHVLLEQTHEDPTSPGNPAVGFLHQKLTIWLREGSRGDADFLVDILYSVLKCCPEPLERKQLLDDLVKMDFQWHVFLYIIQKAKRRLIERTGQQGAHCSDKWALLSLVLSEHVRNESLIAETYVEKIIDKLHLALAQAKDLSEAGDIEPSVSFICDVASNFFSSVKDCLQMPSAEDLLLTIFQLCAQPSDATHLSEALLMKLKHTWMSGLNSLVAQFHNIPRGSTFLNRSAHWVKDQMETSHLTVQSLQSLMVAVDDLHGKILQVGPSASHILAEHVSRMMPSDEKWQKMRQCLPGQWSSKPLLEGRLSTNSETSGTDHKSFPKSWLPHHLCAASLLSKIAFRMLENDAAPKDEEIGSKINIAVAEMLYSLQWCEELERPPAIVTECRHMLRTMDVTQERLQDLSTHRCALLELLYTRSLESGTIWSLTLHKMISLSNPGPGELKRLAAGTQSYFPVTQGLLHTLQCLSPFLPKEDKESLIIQFVSRLMSCDVTELSCIEGGFGFLAILNSCLDAESVPSPEVFPGILKIILTWKNTCKDLFLFSSNLSDAGLDIVGLNVEIIRFFSLFLNYSASALVSLEDTEWDFIMCSMLSWLETACETPPLYHVPLVRLFACVSCRLASDLSAYFQSGAREKLPEKLTSEWNEFFSEGIYTLLLPMLVRITGENKSCETSSYTSVLQSLGEALCYISKEQLLKHKLPAKFVAGQRSNLPDGLQSLLNSLTPLLLYRERAVQVTVYQMLNKIMVDLPAFDEDHGAEDEEEPTL